MMLVWLAFYVLAAFFATRWADFLAIIGCTVPMIVFKKKHRGETFGTVFCNTVKYKKKEYSLYVLFCISGCALISALCYLFFASGEAQTVAARSDFPYLLVFYCFIPAFFEEWLVRGGILGVLAPYKAGAVWICGIFFMLMHANPAKYLYALFAGLLITSLVYLTECIYLGMLLHFLNNFAALLLSYLPNGFAEYIALAVVTVVFALSFVLLKRTRLFADTKKLLLSVKDVNTKEILSPFFYAVVIAFICIAAFRVI